MVIESISFVVFVEQFDVFSGRDARALEFVNASQNFIESLGLIAGALPVYKIFPTRKYKFYVTSQQNIRKLGRDLMKHRFLIR